MQWAIAVRLKGYPKKAHRQMQQAPVITFLVLDAVLRRITLCMLCSPQDAAGHCCQAEGLSSKGAQADAADACDCACKGCCCAA